MYALGFTSIPQYGSFSIYVDTLYLFLNDGVLNFIKIVCKYNNTELRTLNFNSNRLR
jgi:hypothetical protein